MTRIEMVEQALQTLGDASAAELVAFVEQKYGDRIDPRFLPVFLASIRDRRRLESLRQERAAAPRLKSPSTRPGISASSERACQAEQLALQLLAEHGLKDWQFAFNRRKQAMGLCVFARRTIELSIHFVDGDNPWDEIRDTILHEIAHALVGPGHGHDDVWKQKCLEVGARPLRCGAANMPAGKWQARCTSCGTQFQRHRRPAGDQGWFCIECGPEQGRLDWNQVQTPAA